MQQNNLQHTGVMGMKWGHRKAQGRAERAREEANRAKTIANKYVDSMNKKADKRAKQADDIKNRESVRTKVQKAGRKLVEYDAKQTQKTLDHQEKKGPINKNYSKTDRMIDQHQLGTNGVRNISKRMDKGYSYKKASAIETGKVFALNSAITLLTLDVLSGGALHKAGMNSASKFMKNEAARKSIVKIAQNSKFDPIDVAYKIL